MGGVIVGIRIRDPDPDQGCWGGRGVFKIVLGFILGERSAGGYFCIFFFKLYLYKVADFHFDAMLLCIR